MVVSDMVEPSNKSYKRPFISFFLLIFISQSTSALIVVNNNQTANQSELKLPFFWVFCVYKIYYAQESSEGSPV